MAETAALHLREETLDLVDVLMSLDTGKPYYGKNDMEKINALFGLYRRGILKTAGLETFIFYILHQHSDEFVIRICEDGKILRLRFRQFFAVKRGHDSLLVFRICFLYASMMLRSSVRGKDIWKCGNIYDSIWNCPGFSEIG